MQCLRAQARNNFCNVMTFVSLWQIRFHDRMKLECSSQWIPRVVVLGLFELDFDKVYIHEDRSVQMHY